MNCRSRAGTVSGLALIILAAAMHLPSEVVAQSGSHSPYIFTWVGVGNRKSSDFLAVIDADPKSRSYGRVLTTTPVNVTATMPHHTEYEFPPDGLLLANGWAAGQTFIVDLRQPRTPRVAGRYVTVGDYAYPHSFARLPNGHVLAAFQGVKGAYAPPGGLVEMDVRGKFLRAASAAAPDVDVSTIWPYSLAVDAKHDRIVSTNTPMGLPPWAKLPSGSWPATKIEPIVTRHVQIWRLTDLKLLSTLPLPESGAGKHHEYPAEPRLLPDGSMYVNTFRCGLYHVTGIDAASPDVRFVHAFPGGDQSHTMCSVPVVMGSFWIQAVGAVGLIALDISDPSKPVEVARLPLNSYFHMPHWLGADRRGSRVVVTGDDESSVLIVDVDPSTGVMSVDKRFTDEETGAVGVNLTRKQWPHGAGGSAKVHGTLFGPR